MAWRARDNRANGVPDDCSRELLAEKTRSSCAILSVKQERAIVLATKPSIPVVRYAQKAVIGLAWATPEYARIRVPEAEDRRPRVVALAFRDLRKKPR
jgi:hypothetical protein